jgi:threonine dehydrogenase-like Zn-dependent dehydrogenase
MANKRSYNQRHEERQYHNHHEGTMKSVFWEGKPFEVSVRDIPKARLADEKDAVVRVTTAAICGTDLHTYHGIFGSSEPPWPLGHEAIGIVIEVGSAVDTVKVGDRVVIPDLPALGHLEEEEPLLPDFVGFGFGKLFGNLGGCQGQDFVLHPKLVKLHMPCYFRVARFSPLLK